MPQRVNYAAAMAQELLRNLPSIDLLLNRASLQPLIATAGRETVRDRLREVLRELREELLRSNGQTSALELPDEVERRLQARFARRQQTRTQRVINATGVVLHTNLGRAPLSSAALQSINEAARDYCNLEYELATGTRGKRGTGLEAMLRELVGCEAAAVVNNCAAAVLITLNTLAEGGEVIVSRGELIEIGGAFRIPDVIAKSGARLREVGTTNRTRLSDYEKAINENTRVILRAHPSNYRIVGFTEKPALAELAQLAQAHRLPLFEDLGSGCLVDLSAVGIRDEPTVGYSLGAGASLVAFSGDKLLGGPQAGLILGKEQFIKQIKSNPLMRALRVDKLIFAALEATVAAYASGRAQAEIPVLAMLHTPEEALARRASAFLRRARQSLSDTIELKLLDGFSVIGGGSAPETHLPTRLIAVLSRQLSAAELEERLRLNAPPIIGRIVEDQFALDLRTVTAEGEREILAALQRL
jgi:L-seryl-tRNA(Ser) seleniumtransferase